MARLPYVPADVSEPAELVAAIRARRGGALLHLDRMLLHSPPLAAAWNAYLGAIRGGLSLGPRLRELVICAVGLLNGAPYEVHHHGPLFLAAGGTQAQLDALVRAGGALPQGPPFDGRERAALRLAVEMTRGVVLPDPALAEVRAALGDRQAVELVAVIATYNMVSRFLVALGIEPEAAAPEAGAPLRNPP